MKASVKITLYVLLIACGFFFSRQLIVTYTRTPAPVPVDPSTNPPAAAAPELTPRQPSARVGRIMAYCGLLFGVLVGLGLLIARDVGHFTAHRVEEFLFGDEGEGMKTPEYEEAEEMWKRGQYLEAIQHLREYYTHNPRAVFVAKRIAEIYEKDLNHPLAAALEYEELLKKKLPPEPWGWAAIHLSNLYSGKLNKTEQALAVLHRIVAECGDTAPARKARERLGQLEPAAPVAANIRQASPQPAPAAPSGPKLPPGFRPKTD
jgi:hypothetical protein